MGSLCETAVLLFCIFQFSRYAFGVCPTKVKGNECCFGHYWDERSGRCKECRIGYYGKYCTLICLYPNYGVECQHRCDCDRELCNPFTGCSPPQEKYESQSTVFIHTQPALSTPIALKTSPATRVEEGSRLSTFQTILIGVLGIIVIFICVFSIYVARQIKTNDHENQKLKAQRKRSSIREHIDSESYESLQSINMIPLDLVEAEQGMCRGGSVYLQSTQDTTQITQVNRHESSNASFRSDGDGYVMPTQSSSKHMQNGNATTEIVTSNNTYLTVIEG